MSDERASKRTNLTTEILAEQNPLDQEGGFVHVGHKKLAGFSSEESLLYVRHETVELWNALNDTGGSSLSVDGPPGTGKSTEVWAWALWKARHDKVQVIWYHLNKRQLKSFSPNFRTGKKNRTEVYRDNFENQKSGVTSSFILFYIAEWVVLITQVKTRWMYQL
jgi:hypothetical protein